jgi:mannose-1-phosphate guanylyltransferase/mannose-6-phosphate isomerase
MDTHRVTLDVAETSSCPSSDATCATGLRPDGASGIADTCVLPVILCDRSSSCLWPLSREESPKPFWPVLSDRSLLQETALRARGVLRNGIRFDGPLIVCDREHRFLVAGQLNDAGVSDPRIVLAPVDRNSAPAAAAAALIAAERDPESLLWIMPADAMIANVSALHHALSIAVNAARTGRIVTFGLRSATSETGCDYVEIGDAVDMVPGAFDVARVIEKQDVENAAISPTCSHLCIPGMVVATAATLLAEFERHAPEMLVHVTHSIARGQHDPDFIRPDETAFANCAAISLQHAVAKHTQLGAVVPADFLWSDLGDWGAVWGAGPRDGRGNLAIGDVLLEGSDRCLVHANGRLTAVVGLQDVAVVVTEDAVLTMHRDRAQQVQKVVERLKSAGRSEALAHRRVHRPWGFYESLALEKRFQVKRIVVDPGQKLSLQKHFHRSEHWVVVQGSALVTRDDEVLPVGENESIYLPLGCVHRLENFGRIPLVLIEVQLGSYLGEDDIIRIADQYGR